MSTFSLEWTRDGGEAQENRRTLELEKKKEIFAIELLINTHKMS